MHVTPSGGVEAPYVIGLYHNARGQRLSIYFGNGTNTAYTYDPNTFRETQLVTMRSADVMQDLNEGLLEQDLRGHLYANEKSSYKQNVRNCLILNVVPQGI